jgi:hypothetical protein
MAVELNHMIRNGAMSQHTQRHTNRLLGYPDDARLLIMNADDLACAMPPTRR